MKKRVRVIFIIALLMRDKGRGAIVLGVFAFTVLLAVVSFVAYQQTSMLRQGVRNIEYITITALNYHDGFMVSVEDTRIIEAFYDIIGSTRPYRRLFPSHVGSMQADPRWAIRIYYQNGRYDEIFIVQPGDMFYRWLTTRGGHGDRGFVQGRNKDLVALVQEVLAADGY